MRIDPLYAVAGVAVITFGLIPVAGTELVIQVAGKIGILSLTVLSASMLTWQAGKTITVWGSLSRSAFRVHKARRPLEKVLKALRADGDRALAVEHLHEALDELYPYSGKS